MHVPAGDSKPGGTARPPEGGNAAQAQAQEPKSELKPRPPRKYETEVRLSLEDAIRMGLENNLDVKVSRIDDDVRTREVIVAKSVFDPAFNLGSSYARNRDPSVSFFEIGPGLAAQGIRVSPSEVLSYSAGLSGTWTLGTQYEVKVAQVERDRPIANRVGLTFLNPVTSTEASVVARQPLLKGAWYAVNTAEIQIARNNTLISKEQLELTTMTTVFQVESAYWELVFAIRNLEAKSKAYEVALENLENVRKKRAVGALAAIDVTTAESQSALRRVELEDAEELRERARDSLLRVINYTREQSLKETWESGSRIAPFDNIMVLCTTPPVDDPLDIERDTALIAAFSRRPEYRQLQLNVENQQIRIDVAKNALLPSLDLTGRWAQLGLDDAFDESYGEMRSGRFYDWEVGLELSIPLSNRGAKSRYRNARDELRKLKVSKADLENQIVLAVDQAIRNILHLRRKVQDLDERVRLQEELLRAERRKVEVGMSIAYTVSVIENDLVESQAQALRAKADLQIARAELWQATGLLLERRGIILDSPAGQR
ncbi:MAG: TolC family protein [Planctomycetes bacterium]|nr:TolC family protein [Planctomycetota bacterium]